MKRLVCIIGACALITMLLLPRSASAINFIFIDNGISGDGFWQVRSSEGGTTTTAFLDPTGSPAGISGKTQIIFQYFHFVDVGADGGGEILHNTTITTPANLTDTNEVTSAGLFEGENGTISWTAVSFIEPGSPLYVTELTFTSDNPFGPVRLIQYLDEDVEGSTDDVLIPIGTPGADDFQLLTLDDNIPIGVSHSSTYNTAVGTTYIGWAADKFNELRNTIQGAGVAYSIPGEVDTTDLPEIAGGDSRFPGLPAYGPADISSAIAFDLDPEATFASVILALGGSLAGEPPPVPTPTMPQCTPPPSGLVSWWPADGDFADIADANTGSSASAVTFVPGMVGQAFKFNGASDSFITLPNNPNLLPASHTFTIDGWIKIDDASNQFDTLLAKRDGCGEAEISYLLTVNKGFVSPDFVFPPVRELQLVMSTPDGSAVRATSANTGSVVPVDGQYHHVAGTYDGSFITVYIDGQPVGETPYSGPIVPTQSPAVISHHGGTCTERSAAAIDELAFYDRALSAAEIQAIFAADSAGKCELPPTSPAPPSTPDLVDDSDTGISNTDNITNDNTPTFAGTAPPESTVELFADSASLGTTLADATGAWSLTTTLAEGIHAITATATDAVGNVSDSSLPLTVTIDTTGPIIVMTRNPGPNAFGWNNTDVTVIFDCADAPSGLAPGSPPPPTTVSTEGPDQGVTGSCQDVAGNTAEFTTKINIDKTPPTAHATASPAANSVWNNTDVTVRFTGSDSMSGIDTVTDPVTVTAEGPGQIVYGKATDRAGNSGGTSVTLNIDKTPPYLVAALVSVGELEDDEGTFRIEFKCTDNLDSHMMAKAKLNGIPVGYGQVVELELDDDADEDDKDRHKHWWNYRGKGNHRDRHKHWWNYRDKGNHRDKYKYWRKYRDKGNHRDRHKHRDRHTEIEWEDGVLELEASQFTLVVTCMDVAANKTTKNAKPQFALDDDDADDDKDRDKRKGKHRAKRKHKDKDKDKDKDDDDDDDDDD